MIYLITDITEDWFFGDWQVWHQGSEAHSLRKFLLIVSLLFVCGSPTKTTISETWLGRELCETQTPLKQNDLFQPALIDTTTMRRSRMERTRYCYCCFLLLMMMLLLLLLLMFIIPGSLSPDVPFLLYCLSPSLDRGIGTRTTPPARENRCEFYLFLWAWMFDIHAHKNWRQK